MKHMWKQAQIFRIDLHYPETYNVIKNRKSEHGNIVKIKMADMYLHN